MSETTVVHVESGETLSEIAARHGVTVEQLQEWNRIEEADYVQAGQRIVVHDAVVTPGWNEAAMAVGAGGWEEHSSWWHCYFCFAANAGPQLRRLIPESRHRQRRCIGTVRNPLRYCGHPRRRQTPASERVQSVLTRRYRDWPLLNNVLLPVWRRDGTDRSHPHIARRRIRDRDQGHGRVDIRKPRAATVDANIQGGPLVPHDGHQVEAVSFLQSTAAERRTREGPGQTRRSYILGKSGPSPCLSATPS